jgi:hypothetical protein
VRNIHEPTDAEIGLAASIAMKAPGAIRDWP